MQTFTDTKIFVLFFENSYYFAGGKSKKSKHTYVIEIDVKYTYQ